MEHAIEVAEQAAEAILSIYSKDDFNVQLKSDKTPVTEADLLAHNIINKNLNGCTDLNNQQIPVLSEESETIDWQHRQTWQTYWLTDPLDGTKEFVDRNDEFTVNIALIDKGKPIIGVVLAPALGELYVAAKGLGAFKRDSSGNLIAIQVRSVPEQQNKKLFSLLIGRRTDSPSLNVLYQKLHLYNKEHLGSSLKTCRIAEGKADLYPRFGKTSEWDTAAAQCILECAGGAITDLQLSPLRYNTKDSLLNPSFIAWGDSTINWADYLP